MASTSQKSNQRPALDEQEPRFRQFEPSLLQRRQLAGSSAQQTLDAVVDENIKQFYDRVVKSNNLDSLAYGTAHLADGTDGISTLPSAVPSGVKSLVDNDLQKTDGTDGKLLARARERREFRAFALIVHRTDDFVH